MVNIESMFIIYGYPNKRIDKLAKLIYPHLVWKYFVVYIFFIFVYLPLPHGYIKLIHPAIHRRLIHMVKGPLPPFKDLVNIL